MKKIHLGFTNPFRKKEESVEETEIRLAEEAKEVEVKKFAELKNSYEEKVARSKVLHDRFNAVVEIDKMARIRINTLDVKLKELSNEEEFVKKFSEDLSIDQYEKALSQEKGLLLDMLGAYAHEKDKLEKELAELYGEVEETETKTQEEE